MLDTSLLTFFIDRWHKETYSFHLSFGEMTITLDDVSSLFHLPTTGIFFTTNVINQELACIAAVWNLRVVKVVGLNKFKECRGANFHMSWLCDRYIELVEALMNEASRRVYMLHLATCILLADKSHVYIDVLYMWLFSSLDHTIWAWGVSH
ncbi:unnamed protein product [Lathyrus oleraceus]